MNEPFDPSDNLNSDDLSDYYIPSGMEERLMRCRPRSPRLEIDAIVKIAANDELSKRMSAAGQDDFRRYTTPQLVCTTAASWVLGVFVGAACISFSLSSQRTTTQNRDPLASNEIDRADDDDPTASAAKLTIQPNPKSNDSWKFDWNTEQLQVGMSLPSRGKLVLATIPPSDSRSVRTPRKSTAPDPTTYDESSSDTGPLDYYVSPVTPMTQGELLKALSRDTGFRVH